MPSGTKFEPTDKMIEWMYKNNGEITNKKMLEMFIDEFGEVISRSRFQLFRKSLGLKSGLTGRFEKGQKSWNKGIPMKVKGRMAETQFKKGQKPRNYRPIGSERINVDGYIEVKVSDKPKWKAKHRVVWEQQYGEIPDNHIVIFLNGDKLDVRIENLRMIPRDVHIRLNQENGRFEDAEITDTSINIELLKKVLRKKEDELR